MPATAKEIADELKRAPLETLPSLIAHYQADERKQVAAAIARAERRLAAYEAEAVRVKALYERQKELGGIGVVAGADEVGRGAIAGPLTVCACVLDTERPIEGINDSKQLKPEVREELAARIRAEARAVNVVHIEPEMIDSLGMGACLRVAFSKAISGLGIEVDSVLIDGNPLHAHPKEMCIVKGDATVAAIAAASIVAKVTRDSLMRELAVAYPGYGLDGCKGYASAEHISAIQKLGLTPIHRRTFCGNFAQIELPLV